jgi:uncharacterized protein (DUF58 family)
LATRARRAFPLVPRQRNTGIAYGTQRSRRRGQGAEVAGSRRYVPGDRLAWIDWYASARESAVRDDDVFIVRQYFTETAPRVVLLVDRRPSMTLYPADLPWLSKPAVVREATTAIVAASHAARAYMGYLDFTRPRVDGEPVPFWIPPQREGSRRALRRIAEEQTAPEDSFELALDYLLGLPSDVPTGTFVFAVSDFLRPLPDHLWSRAQTRGWDLVPVIVQDRVWEQSFPPVQGLLLPVVDPATGKRGALKLTAREVEQRRQANEERLDRLQVMFRRLQFDPVLLDTADPGAIDRAFAAWASRRRMTRRRAR